MQAPNLDAGASQSGRLAKRRVHASDDLAEIEAGISQIKVQGERLPEAALKMTGR